MADNHTEFSLIEKYPSPEELFGTITNEESALTITRRPIPTYEFKRAFTGLFFLFLAILAFLVANLDSYGIEFYYMRSSSMESEIPKGSFLVVGKVPSTSLEVGDVITYTNASDVSITHEIIEVNLPRMEEAAPSYITKGTENNEPDSEEVSYESVQGKVLLHIPYLGKPFMELKDNK